MRWGGVAVPGKMDGVERAVRANVLKEWNGMEGRVYGFNIYQLKRVLPFEKLPCPWFLLPKWKQTYWECVWRKSPGRLIDCCTSF